MEKLLHQNSEIILQNHAQRKNKQQSIENLLISHKSKSKKTKIA
jgi:hypothetical protein